MVKDEVVELLNLQPHPEGGYFNEYYRSDGKISVAGLPQKFSTERNFGTSIYYLLNNDDKSHFHRLKSDEIWYFHYGASIILHVIDLNNNYFSIILGNNLLGGEKLQYLVPAGCWFAAEVKNQSGFSLVGCAVFPGFDFADFEMGIRENLLNDYPAFSDVIIRFTK